MSFGRRLMLFFSLFLVFSFLVVVSNSEAGRISVKKPVAVQKKKAGAVKKKLSATVSRPDSHQRPLPLEEVYLMAELSAQENAVLQKALGLLGIRYRFGGSSYAGIDCSAFVKKVFAAQSLPLPRTAREQFTKGTVVPLEQLQKGDLLFYQTYAGFPSHVGIYVGNELMIHASSEGGQVMISRMNSPYFLSRFLGARRIQADEGGFLGELTGGDEPEKDLVEV